MTLSAIESAPSQPDKRDQQKRRDIGAERDEGAVAEIEHVHQAEDEGEARRHDEDHHAHGESGDVSVTQVDGEPTSGSAASMSRGTSASGRQSSGAVTMLGGVGCAH